jgi:hypothetical protein
MQQQSVFKSILWVSLMLLPFSLCAQVLSPEQFLGYKVGTRFTRHHQIVNYFTAIAAAKSDMVKLIPYGKTNEGRDLMVAAIGTAENIKNLEQIRKHNLGLVDGTVQDLNQPGIVWLSYNVHGNEPASSEAAMLTLFALVDPKNNETKNWLKNTVVMIDPCINPDGRDRYVNWYNNAVGSTYNTDPASREHMEPWPAGRTNHYNFDLNRDWAWQTQLETQQRIPLYQSWYPQVHVDFHEQGYNAPYYFAPAAEPLHDVLTPWQKSFQDQIGKNHAKYFDQNNWLFFTKERFDLLYPSYGDTYPMYNGAIGMTYEQGGISAGLGVEDNSGDTVTLVARATHHFTTSLSTIEISAANQTKLLENFKKYFDNSRQGTVSDFKTFIMTAKNASQLEGLASLLKKNNIEYGTLKNGDTKFKAFDYYTKKEVDFVNEGYTLAVNANQVHSVLARVLLEPITQVNDSNTYDITAWALPYAYGVHGFATTQLMPIEPGFKVIAPAITTSAYGYLIPYHSFATAKALAQLLKHNVKVRYAEKAFTMNGRNYEIGTLVVLKTSNQANWSDITKSVCSSLNIEAVAVNTGYAEKGADFGSPDIPIINHAPRVAMLTGEYVAALSAGEIWNFFEQQLNYPITQLTYAQLNRIDLDNYDVLIAPDGQYRDLNSKSTTDKLQAFVRKGGVLIALENAASTLASNADWGIKVKENAKEEKPTVQQILKYADREKESIKSSIPGAIYKTYMDETHPLGFGTNGMYFSLKQDMVLYEPSNSAWNVGSFKKDSYITGFAGVKAKAALSEGVLLGVKQIGAGKIIYMADDPIFRNFWEGGKLILTNAVFLHGQ